MRLFIKISLLLFLPAFVKAQQQLSSLRVALNNSLNDTIRMNICKQLASYYYYDSVNEDSAVFYMERSLSLARKLKLMLDEAKVLEARAYSLTYKNYPKALELFFQALTIVENPASEENMWNLPPEQTPHNARINELGYIHLSMAQLYGNTGNNEKKIASLIQAKEIAETLKDTFLNKMSNLNLGDAYYSLHKLDSALHYQLKAVSLFSKSNPNARFDGWILSAIGQIYQDKGIVNLARDAFQKGLQLMIDNNNPNGIGGINLLLSKFYNSINKPDSGKLYAIKAMETYRISGTRKEIADTYSSLSSAYEQLQKKDSAFAYLKLATQLHDSLNDVERKNLLAYQNVGFEEQMRVKKLEGEKIQTRAKIRTYALLTSIVVFMIIAFLLYRNSRHRKKANELLQAQKIEIATQKENVEQTLVELKSTQAQLIQSEKMASLGELTAGIAHEIQNPLNFVNNFSDVNKELLTELKDEIKKGNTDEANAIANDVIDNEEKINHHGKRADAIVKGMLQHSRKNEGIKEPTDINALCDEYLRLSYHGLRAKDKSFNADFKTDFDESIGKINIVSQDIGRVLLNLFNNAFYAVNEKNKTADENYKSLVSVQTKKLNDKIEMIISDNGNGIPQNIIDKIFQPFFTTKPTGQGTGLGLSLAYDIITKEHNGTINVESKEGEGSMFIIRLPVKPTN